MLWFSAGMVVYVLSRQPGTTWFLPPAVELRLAALPLTQIAGAFPIFAETIAVALLMVWLLECSHDGALIVCALCGACDVAFELGQRSDVAAWVIPLLPQFVFHVWPLSYTRNWLGHGNFSFNQVTAAIFASMVAYYVALNSLPTRR
jgi:hypothetical protein